MQTNKQTKIKATVTEKTGSVSHTPNMTVTAVASVSSGRRH